VSGGGCSSDCKSQEICGNAIVDPTSEKCDLGTVNANAPNALCRTNCRVQKCGDSIIDNLLGEKCDDGMMNVDAPNACCTNCQLPRCGDGIRDSSGCVRPRQHDLERWSTPSPRRPARIEVAKLTCKKIVRRTCSFAAPVRGSSPGRGVRRQIANEQVDAPILESCDGMLDRATARPR
jgi:hypothetical protein